MRVDAHQHFWRYDPAEYDWTGEGMERLARDYLPADLAPLLTAEGIAGSVAVQARQAIEETRWLLGLAAAGCAGQLDRLPGAREGVPVGRPQRVAFDADVQGWRTRRT